MNYFYLILVCVCLFSSVINALKEFPPFLTRCSLSDPKLDECIVKATEDARPYVIRNEIPELVPKLTPFFIPEVQLQQGSESVNFKASLKNVSLYGLEQYKFNEAKIRVVNKTYGSISLNADFASLYIEGKYVVDGKILVTPLKGSGFFHANITNTGFEAFIQMGMIKKNGFTYLVPQPSNYKARIGKIVDYGIEGLFKDSKVLASAVQKVIKDNLDLLVEEITPAINEVIRTFLDGVIMKRPTRYPMEVLYKP